MADDALSSSQCCAGTCCLVVFLTFIILLSMSSQVVGPNIYAIKFDSFSKDVDYNEVYSSGRHWNGPQTKFIEFPATIQSLTETVSSRDKTGYNLALTVHVQYKLNKEGLIDLYKLKREDYEPLFQKNVRDAVLKEISKANINDLYEQRDKLRKQMFDAVDEALQRREKGEDPPYAECWGLQIADVNFPSALETALLETQISYQATIMQSVEKQVKEVETRNKTMTSRYSNEIYLTEMSAKAEAQRIIQAGEANATVLTREATASANLISRRASADALYITMKAEAEAELHRQAATANASLIIQDADSQKFALEADAKANVSIIESQAVAQGQIMVQNAVARGQALVKEAEALANQRALEVESHKMDQYASKFSLSAEGQLQMAKLLTYDKLSGSKVLWGFGSGYAVAETNPRPAAAAAAPVAPVMEQAHVLGEL